MTTQPEALRLADAMESGNYPDDYAVAAELRRLHAEIADCNPYLKEGETPSERIQRDHRDSIALMTLLAREKTKNEALLAALKTVEWHGQGSCWVVDADKIAAAIKAAEES